MTNTNKIRVVVLISGHGSNLQTLIEQSREGTLPIKIVAVISNDPAAFGLQRANSACVPTQTINHKDYPDRNSFCRHLQKAIDEYNPDLIVLAGFMRVLSNGFVNHYLGRMLNIHPSLLPKYPGLNTHQRAIDNNDQFHGTSVHFVTPELDDGPVVIQSRVPIEPLDTVERLADRVQAQEHNIYPIAISWFALKRLKMINFTIEYDGKPLKQPILFDNQCLEPEIHRLK